MSKATQQSLCILSAIKSGMVTSILEYQNLTPSFRHELIATDILLTTAIKEWQEHKNDNEKAIYMLGQWVDALKVDGLDETSNLTTMVAMSQQATADLIARVRDKKKISLLTPVLEKLNSIGAYLHEGMSDKKLIPRFELADELLARLYKITGFEV